MAGPLTSLWSVCSDCGAPFEREAAAAARCPDCNPAPARTAARITAESRRGTARSRGYDAAWRRLSKRARAAQPFCSDCGREDTLTTDHSPEAWARRARGQAVRLDDVDVVCRRCNSERGPARGPDAVDRSTIGQRSDELESLTESLDADDDLDQRIARGEVDPWTR